MSEAVCRIHLIEKRDRNFDCIPRSLRQVFSNQFTQVVRVHSALFLQSNKPHIESVTDRTAGIDITVLHLTGSFVTNSCIEMARFHNQSRCKIKLLLS